MDLTPEELDIECFVNVYKSDTGVKPRGDYWTKERREAYLANRRLPYDLLDKAREEFPKRTLVRCAGNLARVIAHELSGSDEAVVKIRVLETGRVWDTTPSQIQKVGA